MGPFAEYAGKGTALEKGDARIKIIAALILIAMVISSRDFLLPAVAASLCLGLCLQMGVPAKVLALRFSEPLFIAAVVILLKLFFSGKDALFSTTVLGVPIVGYADGLREGLLIGGRIIGAVSVAALLAFSTPFTELMAGLAWLRVPRGFIEVLLFAYRAVFVLFEDAQVVYTAQKNRLGYSSLRRGLSSFGTLAGSLTIRAFDNSQNAAIAMAQRGYDGSLPMLRHKQFRLREIAGTAAILLFMGVIWKM